MASLPTSAPVTPLRPGERQEGKNDDADKADSVGTGTTGTAGTTDANQQLLVNSLPTHVGFPTLTAIGGAGVGRPGPTTWAFLDPRRPDLVPVFGPTIAYPSLNSLYETEEVATGQAFDGGMSPVRRFFCLFVTFDVLLTALMWMLSIVITGVNLTKGLQDEIKHYSIYTSLFDLVLVSVTRFVFLILMFGLCKFTHWWPVALATTGSCAFLVAKVFLYSWTQHNTFMFEVVFLLAGFILPWGEAWFVDFRVLPMESKASKLLFRASSEREPLLGAEGGFRTPRAGSVIDRYTASVSNFYSPLASSGASQYGPEEEEEDDGTMYRLYSSKGKAAFTEQEENYRRQGEELVALCWDLLNNANWIQERATSAGELMYSARHPDMRMKLYKIHARLECSPKDLMHEVFYNAEAAPTWNANLKETKVVQIVDEFTDILYQVTNEAAGGLISSRDFVDLRRWAIMEGGVYLSTGKSIVYPGVPPRRGIVRGENGPSCIALFPVPGMPECAEIRAMIQTDLKGWIPQKIIDQAMRDVMSKSVEFMRRRVPLIKVSKQRDALIAIP